MSCFTEETEAHQSKQPAKTMWAGNDCAKAQPTAPGVHGPSGQSGPSSGGIEGGSTHGSSMCCGVVKLQAALIGRPI